MITAFDFVVWIQTSFLGDIILSTGAFRAFRSRFPEKKQILITTQIGSRALAGHSDLDKIVPFEKSGLSLRAFLNLQAQARSWRRELGRGLILQVHKSPRSTLLSHFLGMPMITYHQTPASWSSLARVERVAMLHEAARVALLLEPLGLPRQSASELRPTLSVYSGELPLPLLRFFHDKTSTAGDEPVVGIVPGSVWATKKWPASYYGQVVAKLLRLGVRVLLLGAKSEQQDGEIIVATEGVGSHPKLLNAIGQTSLDELRAIYPRLNLVISNDSSSLHYASAFNIPTIAIFGATVPGLGFGPLSDWHRISEHNDLPCRPCSDHGPQRCPLGHFRCMRDLHIDQVWQHVEELRQSWQSP
jgi:heptosyltransferase-2